MEDLVESTLRQLIDKKIAFKDLSPELRNHDTIMIYAIAINGFNLEYINEKNRDRENIVIIALQSESNSFKFASSRLKKDKQFVCKYNFDSGLKYIDKTLLYDLEIWFKIVPEIFTLKFCPYRIRKNIDLMILSFKELIPKPKYIPKPIFYDKHILLYFATAAEFYYKDRLKKMKYYVAKNYKYKDIAIYLKISIYFKHL